MPHDMPLEETPFLDARFSDVVHWTEEPRQRLDVEACEGATAPYAREVRELLEKHFGRPERSLTLGTPRRSGNTLYFFHKMIDDAQICSLRDTFNRALSSEERAVFPEMIRPEPVKPADRRQALRCVRFRITEGHWYADFFRVERVKYHRTYGGAIAATLITSKHPFVSLSSVWPELLYGLWNFPGQKTDSDYPRGEGMPYRINRNLYDNPAFRGFVVDFLSILGTAEKKYILKDAARTIDRCGFFLPHAGRCYRQAAPSTRCAEPESEHHGYQCRLGRRGTAPSCGCTRSGKSFKPHGRGGKARYHPRNPV